MSQRPGIVRGRQEGRRRPAGAAVRVAATGCRAGRRGRAEARGRRHICGQRRRQPAARSSILLPRAVPIPRRVDAPRPGARGWRRVRSGAACSRRRWCRGRSSACSGMAGTAARAPSGRPAFDPPAAGTPAPPGVQACLWRRRRCRMRRPRGVSAGPGLRTGLRTHDRGRGKWTNGIGNWRKPGSRWPAPPRREWAT